MIRLTRLNGKTFVVNSDLIKFVENAPDTVITLSNGEKVVVKEDVEQVIAQVIAFKQTLMQLLSDKLPAPNKAAEPRS